MKRMFFWLGCLWLVAALPARAENLGELLGAGEGLWQMAPTDFMAAQKCGFRWVSAEQEAARSVRTNLLFAGLPVMEAQAKFAKQRLAGLVFSLYNRGDAGDLAAAEFEKLLRTVDAALTKWAGAKGVLLRDQNRTTTVALRRMAWVRAPLRLDLVWTFTPRKSTQDFRAEFVRLEIMPFDPANPPRAGFQVAAPDQKSRLLTAMEVRARVKRETNGDVLITGIPMVDQGQKGYCAAAVLERVLRYFGRAVDQHEIAQMANTATQGGTSTRGILSALRQMASELGMEVVTQEKFDNNDFQRLLTDYNRAAQRARKPELALNRVMSLNDFYGMMDTNLLRAARLKQDAGMQNFKATLVKYLNAGCPVAWGCIMGLVEETPKLKAPPGSGHLRLIIGFNPLKNEVLYTDTWGAGHELKRMALADAWMITVDTYTIEPRNMRF